MSETSLPRNTGGSETGQPSNNGRIYTRADIDLAFMSGVGTALALVALVAVFVIGLWSVGWLG